MDGTEQVRYWNVGTGSTGTVDLGAGVYYEAAAPGGFIVASAGVLYRQAVTGARTSLGSPPGGVGTIVGGTTAW